MGLGLGQWGGFVLELAPDLPGPLDLFWIEPRMRSLAELGPLLSLDPTKARLGYLWIVRRLPAFVLL
jgi:hypothetical protein